MNDKLNNVFDVNKALALLQELRTGTFLRTKIDIVYSDINNWDYENLLHYREQELNSQKKLSYVEYTWLKIVDELKRFNFTNIEVIDYREDLFKSTGTEEIFESIKKSKEQGLYSDEQLRQLESVSDEELKAALEEIGFSMLELAMIEYLSNGVDAKVLFFKNKMGATIISDRAYQELMNTESLEDFEKEKEESHFVMSLTKILRKFVSEDLQIQKDKKMILSETEYKMITEIRKRLKGIKSVSVRYKEGEPVLLDIKQMQKVKAESSLMAIIKKSKYSAIEMQTENGHIVSINQTEKIKL